MPWIQPYWSTTTVMRAYLQQHSSVHTSLCEHLYALTHYEYIYRYCANIPWEGEWRGHPPGTLTRAKVWSWGGAGPELLLVPTEGNPVTKDHYLSREINTPHEWHTLVRRSLGVRHENGALGSEVSLILLKETTQEICLKLSQSRTSDHFAVT